LAGRPAIFWFRLVPPRCAAWMHPLRHILEICGSGCGAKGASMQRILEALTETKISLGVPQEAQWAGTLYQSANRYAHLHFLRAIGGIEAYLVNVYFVNDPHSPTTVEEW